MKQNFGLRELEIFGVTLLFIIRDFKIKTRNPVFLIRLIFCNINGL